MSKLLILLLFVSLHSFSQCKTFRLTERGDTLNCIDMQGKKQGKWVLRYETVRGEPGYEEEGRFKNDLKEGPWRLYTLMGDFTALENYKWGYKDSISQYYTIAGLEHEESWRAVNPEKLYDTIDMPDVLDEHKITQVRIKNEGTTLRHGIWKYYRPGSLSLLRTETYFLDKVVIPKVEGPVKSPEELAAAKKAAAEKNKPQAVKEFEKKNSGKKSVRMRDGTTGG